MATAILRPSGAGDATVLNVSGVVGNINWQAVDDVVADDDTTNVHVTGPASLTDYYTITNSIPAGSTINQVDITTRALTSDATPDVNSIIRVGVRLAGVDVLEEQDLWLITTQNVWVTITFTDLARPGGGAWSASDFIDLQIAVNCAEGSSGVQVRCTQVFLTVDYEPGTDPGQPTHPLFTSSVGGPFIVAQPRVIGY